MKDITGQRIEVGDIVAFPGPYGHNLFIGSVRRVWQRKYSGRPYWSVTVERTVPIHNTYDTKNTREYTGNLNFGAEDRLQINDESVDGIKILTKAVDNSAE